MTIKRCRTRYGFRKYTRVEGSWTLETWGLLVVCLAVGIGIAYVMVQG